MRRSAAVMKSALLIFLLIPQFSDSFPNHEYNTVRSITREMFTEKGCHCVDIFKTFNKGTSQFNELQKLAFDIGGDAYLQVALMDFETYSNEALNPIRADWGTCFKALHVVIVSDKTHEELLKLSLKYRFTKSVWLIFMGDTDPATFFGGIHLEYNSQIYVVQSGAVSKEVTITEVFKTSKVEEGTVGVWDADHGLRVKRDPRFKTKGDLDGLYLRTGGVESWPLFSFEQGDAGKGFREADGVYPEVWYQLQERTNFTFQFSKFNLNDIGTHANGKWSGMIEMLRRGEIDVLLFQLDYNAERLKIMQLLQPIMRSRFQIFFKPDGFLVDFMSLFRPFASWVWIAILLWIVTASISVFHFSKLCYEQGLEDFQTRPWYISLFFVLQSISFQGSHKLPKSWACRVLFLICYFTAAVLIPSYSAALTSSLAKKTVVKPFDNLETLQQTNYQLLVSNDSSQEYFNVNERDPMHVVYQKHVKPSLHIQYQVIHPRENIDYVCKHDNYAFFYSEVGVEHELSLKKYCKLAKLSKPLTAIYHSLALAKHSPLIDIFNYNILQMQENGLINRQVHKFFPRRRSRTQEVFSPIGLSEIAEAFILIFAAFVISFVILILERNFKN